MAVNRIPLQAVQPDMILGEPVFDERNRPIFSTGTKLTSDEIRTLQSRKVQWITVSAVGAPDPAATEEVRSQAVSRVRERMSWTPSSPFESEIYQLAVDRAEAILLDKAKGSR